jgi:poly(ribitol-phosphate) beta-N-acetylglucosaminyltransferase
VVVPVFNTGEPLRELVESLEAQTMHASHFEVILVDDGSDDGTEDELDDLGQRHPTWVVEHMPNSGWPGRPRNRGVELARGEYVAFVDHDDYLHPTALEKAYRFARRHRSDVVIAREVGVRRSIGKEVFVRTLPRADLVEDPVVRLLTPHKLYRRSLLERNAIRFPEGKVRLEDHHFNMQAFFAADRISIYADSPYYFWTRREHRRHASGTDTSAHEYFLRGVGAVLDVVDAHTVPGPRRDRIAAHWLEHKMLSALAGNQLLMRSPARRVEDCAAVRQLMLARFTPECIASLTFAGRVRAELVRAERLDLLERFAELSLRITTATRVLTLEKHGGRDLVVHLEVRQCLRDGTPLVVRRVQGRAIWEAPALPRVESDEPLDITDDLRRATAYLVLRVRDTTTEVVRPVRLRVAFEPAGDGETALFRGTAHVPQGALATACRQECRYRSGVLDLSLEFEASGWRSLRRLPAPAGLDRWRPLRVREFRLRPYVTRDGNVSLQVEPPLLAAARAAKRLHAHGGRIRRRAGRALRRRG